MKCRRFLSKVLTAFNMGERDLSRSRAEGSDYAGRWGENVAARLLERSGFKILGRRVRVGTRDELDLVARDGSSLVFVEVKTRSSEIYGRPVSAVDRKKRHAMSRAAVRYLAKLRFPKVVFRFDVVEVVGSPGTSDPTVRHIRNAFPLDRRYAPPY
jgi:putative endonuclease